MEEDTPPRHEPGSGYECGLGKLAQIGIKIVLGLFPFATMGAGWLIRGHFDADKRLTVLEKSLDSVSEQQKMLTNRYYHLDVVEERLSSMNDALEEIRRDVREMKRREG